tara:strand:+ start:453 stop:635 length:183 start_codon:yes stop_codon:yes gene_type:complete
MPAAHPRQRVAAAAPRQQRGAVEVERIAFKCCDLFGRKLACRRQGRGRFILAAQVISRRV